MCCWGPSVLYAEQLHVRTVSNFQRFSAQFPESRLWLQAASINHNARRYGAEQREMEEQPALWRSLTATASPVVSCPRDSRRPYSYQGSCGEISAAMGCGCSGCTAASSAQSPHRPSFPVGLLLSLDVNWACRAGPCGDALCSLIVVHPLCNHAAPTSCKWQMHGELAWVTGVRSAQTL